MTTRDERDEMRAHLAELRHAAHGLGKDLEVRFAEVGDKIERLPDLAAKDARDAMYDVEDDLMALGRAVGVEVRRIPREIGHGIVVGASELRTEAARVGQFTRDGIEEVGHRTAEGTRNLLASAAGVRRTPMRGWSDPSHSETDR